MSWFQSACPKCPSHDAFSWKEGDKFGFCFSCHRASLIDPSTKFEPKTENYSMHTLEDIQGYDTRGFKERGITKTVSDHYGVKVSYGEDGTIVSHFYPYTKDGVVAAYKQRELPKKFSILGDFKGIQLFGQAVCTGGKRLVITEGELDCLAVAQAQHDKYQRFYPVVGLPSSAATKLVLEQREWVRSFDHVVIMMDMDEPGQKASAELAKIIGYDKALLAVLPEKDPCDVLIKHGSQALMSAMFDAKPFSPSGIVRGSQIWDAFKERTSTIAVPYPDCLGGLNDKLDGMRMGEIGLFTSGTGAGKSTVIKEIVLNTLKVTDSMVGMVSLEESVGDTAEKFIGMQMKKRKVDLSTEEEQKEAFDAVFGDERLVLLDHQGSVSDESLVDKMEYLALMGCKYIILDHITIAVSEGQGDKTGNEAIDSMMSDLLKLVKKHNIWLGIISHLRKGKTDQKPFEEGRMPSLDDIKGSGSIKQICFDIIAFCRNMVDPDEKKKNTIQFRVLKARFTGRTGDAGDVVYDVLTGRLAKHEMMDFE